MCEIAVFNTLAPLAPVGENDDHLDDSPLEAKYPMMHRLVYSHFGCNVAWDRKSPGEPFGEPRQGGLSVLG